METKRARVILLPVDKRITILGRAESGELSYIANTKIVHALCTEYYHLYFITDDEIKEGECGLYHNRVVQLKNIYPRNKPFGVIDKSYKAEIFYLDNNKTVEINSIAPIKKIVATTDPNLIKDGIAQPSKAFIEKYCKVDGIDEVLIEENPYRTICSEGNKCKALTGEGVCKGELIEEGGDIKVNDHNEITIHPIKDNWSREEVIELLKFFTADTRGDKPWVDADDEWIEDNL